MEWLKGPLRRLVAAILRVRLRLSGRRVGAVILYHRLDSDHAGWDPTGINPAIDVSLFEAEVRHLKTRYRVVPASELLEAVRARKRGERIPVAVTFDDDNASHAAKAMPILKRAALPATFFVCGASLERPFAFWWERVERALASGVASVEELRAMVPESSLNSASTKSGMRAVAADIEFMPPDERDALADELGRRLGPDPPDAGLRAAALRELRVGRLRPRLSHPAASQPDGARRSTAGIRHERGARGARDGGRRRAGPDDRLPGRKVGRTRGVRGAGRGI